MTRDIQIRLTASGGFPDTVVTFEVPIYRRPIGLLTWTLWQTLSFERTLDANGSVQLIEDIPGLEGYETYAGVPGTCAENSYGTPTGPLPVSINRSVNSVGDPLTGTQYNCLPYNLTFNLVLNSLQGSGCLIGYDEFGTPSSPKRKYLLKTFNQQQEFALIVGSGGCNCGQGFFGDYAGSNSIDAITGDETIGATFTSYDGQPSNQCARGALHAVQAIGALGDGYFGSICHQPCVYTESQTEQLMLTGPPCNPACSPGPACPDRQPSGSATETLSNPDTFYNALVRAHAPAGSGISTSITSYDGNFCYTGQAVQHVTVFTNLRPGCQYTYRITYQISGGGTTTEDYNFTADSTTETITDVVPIDLSHTVTPVSAELFLT